MNDKETIKYWQHALKFTLKTIIWDLGVIEKNLLDASQNNKKIGNLINLTPFVLAEKKTFKIDLETVTKEIEHEHCGIH